MLERAKAKIMKIHRGKGKRVILVLSTALCGCLQFQGNAVQAQTCMTQDLFLYVEAKKPAPGSMPSAAKDREKNAHEGIAVREPKTFSSPSKQCDERGTDDREKIAGRN